MTIKRFACRFALLGILVVHTNLYAQRENVELTIDKKEFDPSTMMWYKQPAKIWEDAMPVGNGRLGAMIFGKTDEERIQLNEDTYYSGGPYNATVKGAHHKLKEVQRLVFEEKYFEAQKVFGRYLMGYPVEQQKYQSLGNIHMFFPNGKQVTDYKRWMDLETGITGVTYKAGGVTYRREVLASHPDQAIIIRITADKPGSISFKANLRGERNQAHSNYATDYFRMDGDGNDMLVLTGKSADYMGVTGALRYEARLKAVTEKGTVTVDDELMEIKNADAVTLYLVAATNFVNYKDVSANQHERVMNYLKALNGQSYAALRAKHVQDYSKYFSRVSLKLPTTALSYEPTDVRIKKQRDESDPQIASLGYQFGRYVLIASSRPGTQAANLQGIWNKDMNPWWDSKYTTNINIQMNYWPVESGNLSEMADPLVTMVEELTDQGSQVAKEHYNARGWVFHQNTDLWRAAAPMDGSTWGTFTVGGAWLATHLWEHYLHTGDKEFLKRVYPTLKGCIDFFMDFLVKDPRTGYLVTNPSNSPENFPVRPGNETYFDEVTASFRPKTNIAAGATIDMQILHDIFTYYADAAAELGLDKDYATQVIATRNKLVPPLINRHGRIQEWAQDWEQTEVMHRHLSHLYGLYPGNVLTYEKTPQFMPAARAALVERGDSSHGNAPWSMAWKIPLWARIKDGEQANKMLKLYIHRHAMAQFFTGAIMQIDGTMGLTAGVTEMLIQSHESTIKFLPAIPQAWHTGEFNGVVSRGAFVFDMKWANNKLTNLKMYSRTGGLCKLDLSPKTKVLDSKGKKVAVKKLPNGGISFETKAGASYTITPL